MKAKASKSKVPSTKRNFIQSLPDEKGHQKLQNAGERHKTNRLTQKTLEARACKSLPR